MSDKNFEQILREQSVPPQATNLESRIIAAAKMPQQKKSYGGFIKDAVNGFFAMPKPGLAFAVILILGLFIYGITDMPLQSPPQDGVVTVDELWAYMTDDNGDWL